MWAIASQDNESTLRDFRVAFDIDMPILFDETGEVFEQYRLAEPFKTGAYPHDWIIGKDGTIIYFNNRFDADRMIETIEKELED